jgi:SAM-dependent methyltransferase
MFIGGEIGYRVLRLFPVPRGWRTRLGDSVQPPTGKLGTYWGADAWEDVAGRTVLDFGCGAGGDSIELARRGAARVIGLDVVEEALAVARRAAAQAGVADRCTFTLGTTERVDRIVCVDAFEHFADPAGVLQAMARMLAPGGRVLASFGPTWYHPYGGHSFSAFPWAHLLFTEHALLRWRADHRRDGARRFGEVRGGLNQMTIRRFERLVADSPLRLEHFEAVPIRAARLLHGRLTREFLTAIVRCRLAHRSAVQAATEAAAPADAALCAGRV